MEAHTRPLVSLGKRETPQGSNLPDRDLGIAASGDPQLRVAAAGVATAGREARGRARPRGCGKARGILDRQYEGEGGDGTDACNLAERDGLRVGRARRPNLPACGGDAGAELANHLEQRQAAPVLGLALDRTSHLLAALAAGGWLARVRSGWYIVVPLEASAPHEWREDPWILAATTLRRAVGESSCCPKPPLPVRTGPAHR